MKGYTVINVEQIEGLRIGAAWQFEAGTGYTIQLDALPIDRRIVLAEPKAEVDPSDAVPEVAGR